MDARPDEDFLFNIRSSYLWADEEQQQKQPSSNVTDVPPEENPDICDGLLKTVAPRFSTLIDRSQMPTKEATATSLSEMQFTTNNARKSRIAWTPNPSPTENNSQASLIEPSQTSRLVFLTKSDRRICQVRLCTIVFFLVLFALCAVAIGVPIGLIYGLANNVRTSTTVNITTTTSTTSSSSTTTSTTTTTAPATEWMPTNYNISCSSTCINVSTVTPSTLLASWTFEENVNDVSGAGNNGQIYNGAAFVNGYIGQAIYLQNSLAQFVSIAYIDLSYRSFTVEAWIYLSTLSPIGDLDIFGECQTKVVDLCLHYVIRRNRMYMGFYADDLWGTTNLTSSVWYHVAFVYDYSLNIKYVYLNGILDGISSASGSSPALGPFLATSGNTTIGALVISVTSTYWNGYLDQMTISNRVKTACEILNDASLVAHYPFDGSYNDIGPNSITSSYNPQNNNNLAWISGRVNQGLSFNSSQSYFQACGFYAIGQNQPYSIAMWVNPSYQSGTLFHISSSGTGSGGWCLPMIGFSSNGSIVVQSWQGSYTVSIMGPILPINSWTHLVQTYSSTNGLSLYLNGGLYSSVAINIFAASGVPMCVLLASSGLGTNCQTGQISMGPYAGGIDEFYVFNRELSSFEVCPLAHS